MDQRRVKYLEEAQHKDEILVVREFDFLVPRFNILPKHGVDILQLQGFGVVSIIRLNSYLAQIGDLVIQVTHTSMYTKIQIWLNIRNGARS
jgi:hypothetical protein